NCSGPAHARPRGSELRGRRWVEPCGLGPHQPPVTSRWRGPGARSAERSELALDHDAATWHCLSSRCLPPTDSPEDPEIDVAQVAQMGGTCPLRCRHLELSIASLQLSIFGERSRIKTRRDTDEGAEQYPHSAAAG